MWESCRGGYEARKVQGNRVGDVDDHLAVERFPSR